MKAYEANAASFVASSAPCVDTAPLRGGSADSGMHSLRSADQQSPPAGSRKGAPAAKVAPVGREHGNCQLAAPLVKLMQSESFVLHEAVCESPPSKRVAIASAAPFGVPQRSRHLEPKHRRPYRSSPLRRCDSGMHRLRSVGSAGSVTQSLGSTGYNQQRQPTGSRIGAPAVRLGGAAREHGDCLLAAPLALLMQSESVVLHEAVCESPPSKRVALAAYSAALGVRHLKMQQHEPYLPSPLGGGQCDIDME